MSKLPDRFKGFKEGDRVSCVLGNELTGGRIFGINWREKVIFVAHRGRLTVYTVEDVYNGAVKVIEPEEESTACVGSSDVRYHYQYHYTVSVDWDRGEVTGVARREE